MIVLVLALLLCLTLGGYIWILRRMTKRIDRLLEKIERLEKELEQ